MRTRLCLLLVCSLTAVASIGCHSDSSGDVVEIFDESIRSDAATGHVVNASNAFAFELFSHLEHGHNACISPFSVSSALSMSMVGAGGDTLHEMKEMLHIADLEAEAWHAIQGRIVSTLNEAGKGESLQLNVANRIWLQSGVALKTAFATLLKNAYQSSTARLDFGRRQAAADEINRWVAQATNNRILSSLRVDDVSTSTSLVITNTVYFKAAWQTLFDESRTTDSQFRTLDGDVTVPFMFHEKLPARSGWSDGVQIIELPYRGDALSMVLLVPRKQSSRFRGEEEDNVSPREGLERLEKQIGEHFAQWVANVYEGDVSIRLPRFKFTTSQKLQPALESMGLRSAFTPQANFTGMVDKADAGDQAGYPLWLDDVLHSTFIEVNEEGTEAVAVTHNPFVKSAIREPIVIDRPFLFVIRENTTGLILFLGRVVDPSKQ